MEILGERLKWLRENKRYGQKEVASEIGVTLSGYQKMEYSQANPKIDTLIRIAEFYNVTTDFLLGVSDLTIEMIELREKFIATFIQLDMFTDIQREADFHYYDTSNKPIEFFNDIKASLRIDYNTNFRNYIWEYFNIPKFNVNRDEAIAKKFPIILKVKKGMMCYYIDALCADKDYIEFFETTNFHTDDEDALKELNKSIEKLSSHFGKYVKIENQYL